MAAHGEPVQPPSGRVVSSGVEVVPAQTVGNALRVATKPISPFVFVDDDPATAPTGYSIELWNRVATELGTTTEWVEYAKVGEVVDAVANGTADVGIAAISVTADRESKLDFTHSFFDAGLQVMISTKGEERGFLSAFSWIWSQKFALPLIMFLFIIVMFGHLIWWVERKESDDFPDGYRRGIVEGLWWSLATVTGGDAEKSINRPIGRLISAVWLLFGLFLVAYVTGLVSSNLTVDQLQSSVRGVEDLPGRTVACVPDTVAGKYLEAHGIPYVKVDNVDAAIDMVANGEADATVYDAPVLSFAAATRVRGKAQVIGPIFMPDKYAIAVPIGSELRERIGTIILEFQADGTMQELYNEWFR
jgi:polar amino acid transport system substrate-binding protein